MLNDDPVFEEDIGPVLSDSDTREMMLAFFSDKSLSVGGPIPTGRICTQENLVTVKSLEVKHSVDVAYAAFEENKYPGTYSKVFVKFQVDCRRKNVPKRYVGGLFIVYLKLCLGYDL